MRQLHSVNMCVSAHVRVCVSLKVHATAYVPLSAYVWGVEGSGLLVFFVGLPFCATFV